LRKAKGWTQHELASKLELHKTHVSKFELGIIRPSLDVLKRLAHVFEVSTDYLLFGDEPEFDEQAILSRIRMLSTPERKMLLAMLEGVVMHKGQSKK
jgi:transcriptional regulator with XRE-family HTH domain